MRTKASPEYVVRSQLMTILEEHLYGTNKNRRFNLLSDIVTKNSALNKNTQKCLSFKGELYVIGDQSSKKRLLPNMLHPTLREQMRGYLTETEAIARETALVKGFLQSIMLLTNKEKDYYSLLPTVMHSAVRKLSPYFDQKEGHLSPEEVTAFLVENERYALLLKRRLTINLIDI
jgi:hypothetical protein